MGELFYFVGSGRLMGVSGMLSRVVDSAGPNKPDQGSPRLERSR